jgi:glycosyltransferase involved in cell wall biosynthesis
MHILTDSNIGGAGHQLLALCKGLSRGDFETEIVLPQGAKLCAELKRAGINYTEVPHIADKSFSFSAVRVLRKIIKKRKPHIVHTHAALSGRIAAKIFGRCKIVYTRHSVFEPSEKQKKIKRFIGGANNFLSDAIIAVSPAAKENLITLGANEKKIHVIFNGMPPPKKFSQDEIAKLREKYKIEHDAFVISQIARLTEVKGQDYVLNIAKQTPAIILMAGMGESYEHLQARITNEKIENVRLLGFVENIDEIFAVTDIQISASFGTEATSLALVQGMSPGVPAVVTNYGGNPFVIENGENGLVIPVRDSNALLEATEKIRTAPVLYKKLSAGAQKIYEEKFTEQEMILKTEKLYRQILKEEKNA